MSKSPVRVNIDELAVTELESDFEEFVYQVEKPEEYNSDEEIQGDDIEESSTLSLTELTYVITKSVAVFFDDLPVKLPPTRDI